MEPNESETPPVPSPEVEELRASLADRDRQLTEHAERARAAVERLRVALLASEPALAPELVHGETLDEVEASFAAAKAVLGKVREEVRREQAVQVPAGAPSRTAPQPVSAFDKIRQGLGAH
jgi:hypothetical protein